MRNGVEPRAPLVVRAHDVPRRVLAVGCIEHQVARPRIVVPARIGFHIHRTELPLSQWLLDAGGEPPLLLVLSNLKPELDERDTGISDVFFELRAKIEK